jgi:homoserine acetyltransferase
MPQTLQVLALAAALWSAAATLWIYGDGDAFYPLTHSRANFAAFREAGERGEFHELPAEAGGHYLWLQPDRWSPLVESYLKRRGLPSEKP